MKSAKEASYKTYACLRVGCEVTVTSIVPLTDGRCGSAKKRAWMPVTDRTISGSLGGRVGDDWRGGGVGLDGCIVKGTRDFCFLGRERREEGDGG